MTQANIHDIGKVSSYNSFVQRHRVAFCSRDTTTKREAEHGRPAAAWEQVMQGIIGYYRTTKPASVAWPNLDEDLLNLTKRCASQRSAERPWLASLVQTIQNAINTKTGPEHFPGKPYRAWEATEKVQEYVKEYMLSADQARELESQVTV
jgi:hypothetical protein